MEKYIKYNELPQFPFKITMDIEMRSIDEYFQFSKLHRKSVVNLEWFVGSYYKPNGQITITQTAPDLSSAKYGAEELISQYFDMKKVRSVKK